MTQQAQGAAAPQRVRQPTTYGNPRRETDPKFFRWGIKILDSTNKALRISVYVGTVTICALVIYLGIGAHHVDLYVSDGGDFSCKLNSTEGIPHGQ